MAATKIPEWRKLPLSLAELCIDTTLRCGQSFRWRKVNDEWNCTLHGRIVSLKQDPSHLHYRTTWPKEAPSRSKAPASMTSSEVANGMRSPVDDTEALLKNYFNLQHDLTSLYDQWAKADPNFRKRAPGFGGVRILNQDAWETLICFICSSNNNISRISQMVHKLCIHYGPLIGTIDGEIFHDFPTPEALTGPSVESHLRELGFGYRAKYIAQTARIVAKERPAGWLLSLRNPDSPAWAGSRETTNDKPATYREAHDELLQLSGVGPKVADCVCLMGLGWGEAVPVDTHVWQIAVRDYRFGKGGKTKTFNKAMYDAVGDHFRGLWGKQAGWAHSVLFTADLKTFSGRLAGKKEEEAIVEIKQEVVVEEVAPAVSKRKRSATVKAEDAEDVPVLARRARAARRVKAYH